jgi:hypothetical protein
LAIGAVHFHAGLFAGPVLQASFLVRPLRAGSESLLVSPRGEARQCGADGDI